MCALRTVERRPLGTSLLRHTAKPCRATPQSLATPVHTLPAPPFRTCSLQVGRGYGNAREALLLNGKFVLAQLEVMAAQNALSAGGAAGKGAASYAHSDFAKALAAEVGRGRG